MAENFHTIDDAKDISIMQNMKSIHILLCFFGEATYHFCLVQINGAKMTFQAMKPDGKVFDSLVIEK